VQEVLGGLAREGSSCLRLIHKLATGREEQ
jgi:hypothetical protein